ncbi:MAG: hypothetical protein JWR19_1153 [Pedosphaera sp.]|nr:hypothetical protein [Pedosphaera sp.]
MNPVLANLLDSSFRLSLGLFSILLVCLAAPVRASGASAEIAFYVSATGNDVTGDGSIGNPWQTVAGARDYIRTAGLNTNMQGDIVVYLRGGRYQLSQTLAFTDADSGANSFYVIYKAFSNEVATISGGLPVTHWSPVAGKPYWVASVPTNSGFANYFRQLYVNGIRAERAHSDWITGVSFFDDSTTTQSVDGLSFQASDLKSYSQITDLRLLHVSSFKVDEFPVVGITTNSTNGLVQMELQQPYCQIRNDYGGGDQFRVTNQWMLVQAFEELDEPGEWYLNRATQQVYYYPYSYETNMNTVPVYAPAVETLVSLKGTSTTNKVQNIRFQNLILEHGNWFFPQDYFIGGSQAEILMPGVSPNATLSSQYGYEMPGQIVLNNTKNIQFIGNTVRHLGSCGIHPYNGALNTLIQGNIFYDLTGAAVLGGRWGGDAAILNQQICTNTMVADNIVRNTGGDFMASSLINNLSHYSFQVLHNDMADSQYMGFHQRTFAETLDASAGIGGTVVSFNRISLANTAARYGVGDCACIYSFGVWPDTIFQGNDINGINYAKGESRGMMFDNVSYGLTASSNVVRNVKPGTTGYFLYTSLPGYLNHLNDNYGDATKNNFKAVTNVNFHNFTGALPADAQGIVANAGLEAGYTNLLQFINAGTNLARGKSVWASSQAGTNTLPSAAVDWDYASLWQPADNDTNESWWAVDLGASYAIQRIELSPNTATNQPDARRNFQVQGANNPGFTNATVLSEQNAVPFAYHSLGLANSWVKYINNPQGFRYLRVIKTARGTLSFSEFQVLGYPADPGSRETSHR